MVNLSDYEKELECHYKNEHYSVRDNGAVLRHPLINDEARSTDNKWTFGKLNNKTGYLEIAAFRVHRIVATAFHGEPPTKEHVVDHIDTNKQNNRPENLRWVTRLENVLLNPITVKRIETVCGCSVEEFLTDPSKFRNKFQEQNYEWMCTVSIQEAQASKARLLTWAESDKLPSGGSLGEWIYNRSLTKTDLDNTFEFPSSITQNAVQKNWKTLSEFPCCPTDISNNSITDYVANLKPEKIFSTNQYADSIIEDLAISSDKTTLWVLCRSSDNDAVKPYLLTEVALENNYFVHKNLGSFLRKMALKKNLY